MNITCTKQSICPRSGMVSGVTHHLISEDPLGATVGELVKEGS